MNSVESYLQRLKQEVENYDNPAMNGFSEDFKQTWNLTEEQIIKVNRIVIIISP